MPRRGENIYMRKDGRYEGRYAKGRREDGRLQYGCIYGYDYEEVLEKLKKARKASVPPVPGTDGSVCGYMKMWLEGPARERISASSYSRYYYRIQTYIIPALGEKQLRELKAGDIEEMLDGLAELSPSTVESVLTTLRVAMKEAVARGYIEEDPSAGVTISKERGGEREAARVLTREEQMRLVAAAEQVGAGVELSVLLSLYAGLSTGEICALRWKDADLTNGTLTVGNVLQRVKLFEGGQTKSVLMEAPQKGRRAQRRIPLPRGLIEKLREYGEKMPRESYILSGDGKPVEPRKLRAWLDKAERAAGFETTYQELRRTYASQCMENSCGEETLSQLLGHTNTFITRRMRACSAIEHGRQVAERVWTAGQGEGKLNIKAAGKASG